MPYIIEKIYNTSCIKPDFEETTIVLVSLLCELDVHTDTGTHFMIHILQKQTFYEFVI